jgi:hypothetical protein
MMTSTVIRSAELAVRGRAGSPRDYRFSPAVGRWHIELARIARLLSTDLDRALCGIDEDIRLDRYLRGWGEYFKRAQAAGVFDRHDRWILRRLRAFVAKRWRNGLWRRYPDRYFWVHLHLTRLYRLRQDFLRELQARRGAGNRPVERSAGNPHATFVRGTEASS